MLSDHQGPAAASAAGLSIANEDATWGDVRVLFE